MAVFLRKVEFIALIWDAASKKNVVAVWNLAKAVWRLWRSGNGLWGLGNGLWLDNGQSGTEKSLSSTGLRTFYKVIGGRLELFNF